MSRKLKIAGLVVGAPVLLLSVLYVNAFVYPFTSKQPNFADVEAAFSRLSFPADWQEISSRENKGIAGRQCDFFDSSGCFHKSKTFKVPELEKAKTEAIDMMKNQTTCKGLVQDTYPEGMYGGPSYPETGISLSCQEANGGISYGVSISQTKGEVSVTARSY